MRLASFDLGRKNFAVFVVDVSPHTLASVRSYKDCANAVGADTETEIVHWENSALPDLGGGASIPQLVQCMSCHVRANWELFGSVDCVVIEQQLLRNPAMKCAAHALQAIFAFHGKPVELLPAKSKFKAFPGAVKGNERSQQLKRASVATAREWLVGYQGRTAAGPASEALARVVGGGGKLDDLCDAALQGLSALFLFRRHTHVKAGGVQAGGGGEAAVVDMRPLGLHAPEGASSGVAQGAGDCDMDVVDMA